MISNVGVNVSACQHQSGIIQKPTCDNWHQFNDLYEKTNCKHDNDMQRQRKLAHKYNKNLYGKKVILDQKKEIPVLLQQYRIRKLKQKYGTNEDSSNN